MKHVDIKSQIGNFLVSTVDIPNGIRGAMDYETVVVPCDDKGNVTDWDELYCLITFKRSKVDEQHAEGIMWAREESNRQGDKCMRAVEQDLMPATGG